MFESVKSWVEKNDGAINSDKKTENYITEKIYQEFVKDFSKTNFVYICEKVLLWESEIPKYKKECCVIKPETNGPEFAIFEFGRDEQMACFVCG